MAKSIYIIRCDSGPIKIGIAGNVSSRLSGLRTSSHMPLHLEYSAIVDGDAPTLEKCTHAVLRKHRLRGEWFNVTVHEAIGAMQSAAAALGFVLQKHNLRIPEPETPELEPVSGFMPKFSAKVLLTDRVLRAIRPAPHGKRTVIWDSAVPGLCLRITDKGSASFSVMRRLNGKMIRRLIGVAWRVPYPTNLSLPYSLDETREFARATILDISHGNDPKMREA